jgi:hypothetical protein
MIGSFGLRAILDPVPATDGVVMMDVSEVIEPSSSTCSKEEPGVPNGSPSFPLSVERFYNPRIGLARFAKRGFFLIAWMTASQSALVGLPFFAIRGSDYLYSGGRFAIRLVGITFLQSEDDRITFIALEIASQSAC